MPSLVTNVGIATVLIPDKRFGTIISEVSGPSIAKEIAILCSDLVGLRNMGKLVRMRARQMFSWDKSVEDLLLASKNNRIK